MFKKKIFRKCQNCRSPLNPKFNIGAIGCCDRCGWAGSHHSYNYADWIQFKVSAILIMFGLGFGFMLTQVESSSDRELTPMVQKLFNIDDTESESEPLSKSAANTVTGRAKPTLAPPSSTHPVN